MYKHLLIGTDGSELATKALAHGLGLAKHFDSKVTVAIVSEPWSALAMSDAVERHVANPVQNYEKAAAAAAERVLSAAAQRAKEAGLVCETVHVSDQHPAEGIIQAAEARECDLIVMASHGRRGLQKLLLGSQATRVLTLSMVPVLIVK